MFFSRKEYLSPKNGIITVSTFLFETPSISVNKCLQSGPYIMSMWKNAFARLPAKTIPQKILLLGLGGGNVIKLLQKKYPSSSITVIEWDEVMIQVAHDLQLFSYTSKLNILHANAFELLPTLQETFDLIIVDLFTGDVPPVELTKSNTMTELRRLLSSDGQVLANFFRHKQYGAAFVPIFKEESSWKFKQNNLALYSHKNV
jgi:spermidine synthase